MPVSETLTVDSPVGKSQLDASGSAIAAIKLNPAQAYPGIPALLKSLIDESNTDAWQQIKGKIDYLYGGLGQLLGDLDRETQFARQVKARVNTGKKLLFKPNLVAPYCIDNLTHGEGAGYIACTPWAFLAALMRWFHDTLDIPYYKMAVGEAASTTSITAGYYTLHGDGGRNITSEAVIEGRSGDFYGGWGFYFARKYLAESHDPSHKDDPMRGYEESVSGEYRPPGRAGRRLMVYDLNRTYDSESKAREIPVPGGENFKKITLHKVITGGNPDDPEDMKDYPGCVLINVPRLKVHSHALLTNAIKNLGIGLYPMEASKSRRSRVKKWKYCFPADCPPGLKTEIPHQVWVPKVDDRTGLPVRDINGEYIVSKTAGLSGTMVDVIKATQNQGVFILHVADAIEAVNIDHTGSGLGVPVPEGYVFASLDPVALDLLCARYMFKTIPLKEARNIQEQNNLGTDFLQNVPSPAPGGTGIQAVPGFDSPVVRYGLFEYAEKRGLGQQKYHVTGCDLTSGFNLASLAGHLGRVEKKKFTELITSTLYFDAVKMLWDLQKTALGYFGASDKITGSAFLKEILTGFDENGDGVIDYDEMGKEGFWLPLMRVMSRGSGFRGTEKYGFLHWAFLYPLLRLKYSDSRWNPEGHNFTKYFNLASVAPVAFKMSRAATEEKDPFVPGMTWGKGKWPSVQFASYISVGAAIFGAAFPAGVSPGSAYGYAFQYADKKGNAGRYTGRTGPGTSPDALNRYQKDVAEGASPLDFVFYVPEGYGKLAGNNVINVVETGNPEKIFTAAFNKGKEVW